MAVGEKQDFFCFVTHFNTSYFGKPQMLTYAFPESSSNGLLAFWPVVDSWVWRGCIGWTNYRMARACRDDLWASRWSAHSPFEVDGWRSRCALAIQQRADIEEIKCTHTTAFTVDAFVAFEQFVTRQLHDGETVSEFLVALERLARQVGERPPEKWIACVFVAGLPQHVRQQLRALAQMDTLTLDRLCVRAWAILVEDHKPVNQIVAVGEMVETLYAVHASTLSTWIMGASRDMQQEQTTGYDDHAKGYSASDAKGWVTLH